MSDRWPPKFLLIPAIMLFLLTSILPLGWMQGKFLYGLTQNPEIAEKALLTSLSCAKIHLTAKVGDLEVLGRFDLLFQK